MTPSTSLLDPPFLFYRKLKRLRAEKYPDSKGNRLHDKILRIQSSHFKFRAQNLGTHDQTREFLFRICPLVCKWQNQSGTETFRIHHESGTIPLV